ncbi:MAG: hypothetical protein GXP08_11805 [Gammaproteobacteria bacterium]|nr:hypothetical protein [Gammaproteobacteria bacterium]
MLNKSVYISLLTVLSLQPVIATAQQDGPVKFIGDFRTGYFDKKRDDRDGSTSEQDEWRARIRLGVDAKFKNGFISKLRFAGRYSNDQERSDFVFDGTIPSSDGLKLGESTLDTAYVGYKAKKWNLKVGRLQTKTELLGVAKKSLDRNNSPNTDVTWTDGAMFTYNNIGDNWKARAILQHNQGPNSTGVRRKPLDFSDSGSRISYFFSLENMSPVGSIVQRGINLSYLPESLQREGNATGRIDDYWALTAKTAAVWPLYGETKFMLAGELGYALNTQTKQALGTGVSGDTRGEATQITANFLDIVPNHSLGIVYGYVGGGWLLSPDFRNNNTLIEARYKWKVSKKFKWEARLRQRKDIDKKLTAIKERVDVDYYVRATYKF